MKLTQKELQLLLSLYFGDGCYFKQSENGDYYISTSCINKDYLEFKKGLLSTLTSNEIGLFHNKGYKKDGEIYKWFINASSLITELFQTSFEEKLELLDKLGVALWFLDDGSLHKKDHFYNLSTHSFTVEEQKLIIKRLENFGIFGHLLKEIKKDGKIFYYITVNKYAGAYNVSKLLQDIPVSTLKYKIWPEELTTYWEEGINDFEGGDFIKYMKFRSSSKARKGIKHKK